MQVLKKVSGLVRRVPFALALTLGSIILTGGITWAASGGITAATDGNGNGAWQTGPTASAWQLPDLIQESLGPASATSLSGTVFVAPNDGHTYQVTAASIRSGGFSTQTANVEVAGAAVAVGSGTAQLSTGMGQTAANINTTVNGSLIAAPTAFGAGSVVNVTQSGSLALGTVTVQIKKLV